MDQGSAASRSERPRSERPRSERPRSERPRSEGVVEQNGPTFANVNENEKMNGDSGIVAAEAEDGRSRTGGNFFLLATLVLGLNAYIVSVASQAIVAATISNAPVRILWFGVVVQTIVTILVIQVITSSSTHNAAYAYGTQISIFAALATVFAVIGVDQNIYASAAAQKATGAGWLLVAIVDLLWIVFFTSPPQSHAARLTNWLGQSVPDRSQERRNEVQKITRSTDAFTAPPANGAASARYEDGLSPEEREKVQAEQQDPNAKPKTASGNWSVYRPPQGGARATMTSVSSEHHRSAVMDPREGSILGSAPPGSPPAPDEQRPLSHATNPDLTVSSLPDSAAKWRAEALFEYKAASEDPNELSFKKGETLLIFDKSGKWWEAKTRDGRRGIAPSNYLRLL